MSKSSLIIDTPEHCYLCTCYTEDEGDGYCLGITAKRVPTEGKPSWCPLKPYKKVNAIPIEWIEKWVDQKTGTKIGDEIGYLEEDKKMLIGFIYWLVHDWEKENEQSNSSN